jgi:hypothetical protein
MLGVLNSAAVIVQAKVAGQAADTVVAANVTAMLEHRAVLLEFAADE